MSNRTLQEQQREEDRIRVAMDAAIAKAGYASRIEMIDGEGLDEFNLVMDVAFRSAVAPHNTWSQT
jgi:hypothetical protein